MTKKLFIIFLLGLILNFCSESTTTSKFDVMDASSEYTQEEDGFNLDSINLEKINNYDSLGDEESSSGDTQGEEEEFPGLPEDFGKACSQNSDCSSGLCVNTGDGFVCSMYCTESCPEGYMCKQITQELPDIVFGCFPEVKQYCTPCESDLECGGKHDHCIEVSGQTFCSASCISDEDCPEGYYCKEFPDLDAKQCYPSTDSCICKPGIDGTIEACYIQNEYGTCFGQKLCEGAKGWSECSANTPEPEKCDGIDNNCDGNIDEGMNPKECEISNEFGTCKGIATCEGEKGYVCDAKTPEEEKCDGVDNDCDGETDEGFSDLDGDKVADCVDNDLDGDGIQNEIDNCPDIANPEQVDTDNDKIGDACDEDIDNDDVLNDDDNCPKKANPGQEDIDEDGKGDVCDNDMDGDTVSNDEDNCPKIYNPEQYDLDGDGTGNECDDDMDGDGVLNNLDNCPQVPNPKQEDKDFDGIGDACSDDIDGDGIKNNDDNCPEVYNPEQSDIDGDTIGDVCDDDADGDSLKNSEDNCPYVANPEQKDTDNDTIGDACDDDIDGDGHKNDEDCKPYDYNVYPGKPEVCDGVDNNCDGMIDEGYTDSDNDGIADCVDNDVDGDGILNKDDNCPDVANSDQADLDGDGEGDVCDDDIDGDGDLNITDCAPKNPDISSKKPELCDGVDNNCNGKIDEDFPDTDNDGIADCVDEDIDGDGVNNDEDNCPFDFNPNQLDADTDGKGDACDEDKDGDGVLNDEDNCPDVFNPEQLDADGNGIGDACDVNKPGPLHHIIIRNAPNGGGNIVEDLTLKPGDTYIFYAAGYDANSWYVGDVLVTWKVTGTLDPIPNGPSKNTTFKPETPLTTGKVVAIPVDPDVIGDETGLITVTFPEAGPVDITKSTISSNKTFLEADGEDTAIITVKLYDQFLTPVTQPHDVKISTTLGTMVGEVVNNNDGSYTQVLKSATVEGEAIVTATVDGELIEDSVKIPFIKFVNPVDENVSKITCENYEQFKNKNIIVKNTTLIIDSDGCAPMKFGHITIVDNGILTHSPASGDKFHFIDIHVKSLKIDKSSKIDVSGKGYQSKYSFFGNSSLYCGGSYGGLGGKSTGYNSCPKPIGVYGDMYSPRHPGSGAGGAGGGLVRITVLPGGGISINGSINADGQNGGENGGGSGGGVFIQSDRISGTGTITARGGNGGKHNACCGYAYQSGGGGGGRIAIVNFTQATGNFALSKVKDNVLAYGGNGISQNGGAGTIFLKPKNLEWGILILNNAGKVSFPNSTPLVSVPRGNIESMTDKEIVDNDAEYIPDFYRGYYLNPNVNQNNTETISDDKFFKITGNTENTIFTDSGLLQVASVGDEFNAVFPLNYLEVMGKAQLYTTGDIYIINGNLFDNSDPTTLILNGGINANIIDMVQVKTIKIKDGIFTAKELISGTQKDSTFNFYLDNSTLNLDDLNGIYVEAKNSTINSKHVKIVNDLYMNNSTANVEDVFVNGSCVLENSGKLIISKGVLNVYKNINLKTKSLITSTKSTQDNPVTLSISCENLNIDSQSLVDVSGKGFPAGVTKFGSISGHCGGSFGGIGGAGSGYQSNNSVNKVYGNMYEPFEVGSGGSGGAGGGALKIVVKNYLNNDGKIAANGEDGGENGGGSGGSIIIEAKSIAGSGVIEAKGGNGGKHDACCGYAYKSGGGGGGRIAIVNYTSIDGNFSKENLFNNISASGGTGHSQNGGAGTIFLKSKTDTYGTLIVDNKNITTPLGSTPIITVPEAEIVGIEGNKLNLGGGLSPNYYNGYYVSVNTGAGDPTLTDDGIFKVVSNDNSYLVFSEDDSIASVAKKGNTVIGITVLDHFDVLGKANVKTIGNIIVKSGNFSFSDDKTFVIKGGLQAKVVELQGISSINISNQGGIEVSELVTDNKSNFSYKINIDNGYVKKPEIFANYIEAKTGNIEADSTTVEDYLELDNSTAKTGTLDVENDISLLNKSVITITNNSLKAGGKIELKGSSKITIPQSNDPLKLIVQAKSIVIDSTSEINVDGKGYPAGKTYYGSISGHCGASHGGVGGVGTGYQSANLVNKVYGNLFAPDLPGSGGSGGAGGGVLVINVSDYLVNDGKISANGISGGENGGGAGGSILIKAKTVIGAGKIQANGGNGGVHNACCGYAFKSGGGGGGRIAIIDYVALNGNFNIDGIWENVTAYGGNGGSQNGGAGTIFLKKEGAEYGDLIVDNGMKDSFPKSTTIIAVPEGIVISSDDSTISCADTFEINRYKGYYVNPDVNQGELGFGDDKIFQIKENDISKLYFEEGSKVNEYALSGKTYRGILVVSNLEVRGKANFYTSGDIYVINGDLSSNDDKTMNFQGSLEANIVDLNNVTNISYNNGGLKVNTLIAKNSTSTEFTYNVTNGNVNLPSLNVKTLDALNSNIQVGELVVSGDVNIDKTNLIINTGAIEGNLVAKGNSVITLNDDNLSVTGNIVLKDTSKITSKQSTLSEDFGVVISAQNLTIEEGASIDVTGKGLPAGTTYSGAISGHCGGSYGGKGSPGSGYQSNNTVNDIYGNLYEPVHVGSGGSGGAGGGRIYLDIKGFLVVDGKIVANGVAGGENGGGSGGSIVIKSQTISGTGYILANGGNGGQHNACCGYAYQSGGGGGGRIALLNQVFMAGSFAGDSFYDHVQAHGGSGTAGNGGAGTIYVKMQSQEHGDLIVDNNNIQAPNESTPLIDIPEGIALAVMPEELYGAQGFTPHRLIGYYLDPNINQGAETLSDDKVFKIIDNDEIKIVVEKGSDMTTVAKAGDKYHLIYVFDNLEIRGKSSVSTGADMLILKGDIHSNDDITLEIPAGSSLKVNILDINESEENDLSGDVTYSKLISK